MFINREMCALELMTIKICKQNLNKDFSDILNFLLNYISPLIMYKINTESKLRFFNCHLRLIKSALPIIGIKRS